MTQLHEYSREYLADLVLDLAWLIAHPHRYSDSEVRTLMLEAVAVSDAVAEGEADLEAAK